MIVFYSECPSDYSSYTFPYAVYAIKERQEELPEIYARGFLPYTGDLLLPCDIFYLARSLRVDLARFEDLSENRRVDRKVSELGIELAVQPRDAFDTTDAEFRRFCLEYADERFSGGSLSAERLDYVLSRGTLTHLLRFASPERVYGYVFACIEGEMLHYWYSFFDVEFLRSHSLGKWMMWRTIRWAKDSSLRYAYLGTCYKEKALYKVRDHRGAEFFDGAGWSPDEAVLKELCRRDEADVPERRDLFKLRDDPRLAGLLARLL